MFPAYISYEIPSLQQLFSYNCIKSRGSGRRDNSIALKGPCEMILVNIIHSLKQTTFRNKIHFSRNVFLVSNAVNFWSRKYLFKFYVQLPETHSSSTCPRLTLLILHIACRIKVQRLFHIQNLGRFKGLTWMESECVSVAKVSSPGLIIEGQLVKI